MHPRPIYLDNMATTRMDDRVLDAMLPWLTERYGNASSTTHRFGWEAASAVDKARQEIAGLIGARTSSEIYFTSGATESNNMAIKGLMVDASAPRAHMVTTEIEHPSVLEAVRHLGVAGVEVTFVKPDADGIVSASSIAAALRPNTRVVSVMAANNEVGTFQPIEEISRITRPRGILLHVDAAQAVGKVDFNVEKMGLDLVSLSAHKLYGPKGIGTLYVSADVQRALLHPLLHGGGQEGGLRSGTLPVALIVGFGAAACLAAAEWIVEADRIGNLRKSLWTALQAKVPRLTLLGSASARLPGCLTFSIDGVLSDAMVAAVPELAISTGSACSSHHGGGSHVLRAMGIAPLVQRGALRIGIGRFTTQSDIEEAGDVLCRAIDRLRGKQADR